MSAPPLVIVGIGADGWVGLGEAARTAVLAAEVIVGSKRHLALLPETPALRRPWPSPIDSLLEELVTSDGTRTCVLASGDPMLHGVGATLARRLGRTGCRCIRTLRLSPSHARGWDGRRPTWSSSAPSAGRPR